MISTAGSVSSLDDNVLTWSEIKADDTSVIIQNVNITQINLEVCDRQSVLVQVRSVHDFDGPWLEGVVDEHDLDVSVQTLLFVDGICEIGSHQVFLSVFNVMKDFSSAHSRVCDPHVVLDLFWNYLL